MKRNFIVSLFGSFIGLGLLFLLLNTATVHAAGVVTNCTGTGLANAMNAGSGSITFDCGPAPVVITVTQAGGFNVIAGRFYTIDGGNKVTLTGAGANRLFDIQASSAALTLTNIILTDGNEPAGGSQGGAILNDHGRLVLDHVTIRNSRSTFSAGAIEDFLGTTIVKDSLIENNQSDYGGGIDSLGTLTLINSIVRYNHATGHSGGGLDVGGRVIISNSQIYSNSASVGNGGGLAASGTATVTISNSLFISNVASAADGGGIYSQGALTLTNVTLSGNSAILGGGGGIANHEGTATLNNSTFNGNSANLGGGIYSYGLGTPTAVINSTFSGNSATEGGAIYINEYGDLTLNNSTLSGNSAINGGGIFFYRSSATVNASMLSGNTATSGGGIYAFAGGPVLDYSTLSGNSASGDGGGIYLASIEAGAVLNYSTLSGNSASGDGGGIYNFYGSAQLHYSTVRGNSATNGGGLFITGQFGFLTANNSTLSGNSALQQGGGIYVSNLPTAYLPTNLTNSTLSSNSALQQGGGIYNNSNVQLLNVTLSNNSAASGGALFTVIDYTTSLTNTIVAYSPAGGNCNGTINTSIYSISSDLTCALAGTVKGLDPNGLDPLLTALGNYGGPTLVHMPKLGSPAIDGVVGSSNVPANDQRGKSRPQGSGFDIGAVERQPADSSLAPRIYLPLALKNF